MQSRRSNSISIALSTAGFEPSKSVLLNPQETTKTPKTTSKGRTVSRKEIEDLFGIILHKTKKAEHDKPNSFENRIKTEPASNQGHRGQINKWDSRAGILYSNVDTKNIIFHISKMLRFHNII